MSGRPAPTAVLQDVIKGFVAAEGPEAAKAVRQASRQAPSFVRARTFKGVRPGYYFANGDRGTGYYLDPKQPPPELEEEVELELAEPAKPAPKSAEELLEEAEKDAGEQLIDMLDERSLRKLMQSLDRKIKTNLQMRTRYPDQPEKFMQSEVDLDDEVKKLLVMAGSPELYPVLVEQKGVEHLLGLLVHQNIDIVSDVVEVFEDLTDADVVEDSAEEVSLLVNAILEQDGLHQLVHRLRQFREAVPEEATAVQKTLSVFENLVEVNPDIAEQLLAIGDQKSGFLKWMLDRLKTREFEGNKQYVAELLAILLQTSSENQRRVAAANGIDILLQALAPYRAARDDPIEEEEEEYISNLCQCLCSCLMRPENKSKFLEAEGLQLMVMIVRAKTAARTGALKTVGFAVTRYPAGCEKWVDVQGLKATFGIFMGKSKVKRHRAEENLSSEEEEQALSIICNLLQNLPRGQKRERVAAKFVENEFEKIERLLELYHRYWSRLIAEQAKMAEEVLEEEEDLDEDDILARRLDAGLFVLQQCTLIVGNLWLMGDAGVKRHIVDILHQKSHTLDEVREVLREYRLTLGAEGDEEERERQQARARRMLVALGVPETELDEELREWQRQRAEEAAQRAAAQAVVLANGDAQADEGQPMQNGHAPPPPPGAADDDMDVEVKAEGRVKREEESIDMELEPEEEPQAPLPPDMPPPPEADPAGDLPQPPAGDLPQPPVGDPPLKQEPPASPSRQDQQPDAERRSHKSSKRDRDERLGRDKDKTRDSRREDRHRDRHRESDRDRDRDSRRRPREEDDKHHKRHRH